MLTPLSTWGAEIFEAPPTNKTLLKIAAERGLNPVKAGGSWYVRRLAENIELPKNLYSDGKRFRYRNPKTGERHWMPTGTTKQAAVDAAIELNARLVGTSSIVSKILGSPMFKVYSDEYLKRLRESDLSAGTKKQNKILMGAVKRAFDKKTMDEITLQDLAEFLKARSPNTSSHYRHKLVEIYKIAVAEGVVPDNLAEKTERIKRHKKKRPRLTMERYQQIYSLAPEWLQIAMDLALLTTQREGDVLAMRHDHEENGKIPVIQEKTKAPILITPGPRLRAVINRSMRSDTLSQFIVHRRNVNKPSQTHVRKRYLQDSFLKISRQVYGNKPHATFHEIRSLGITMYRSLGWDAQTLAGHATEKQTDAYDQEIRWDESGTL